ncbi:MAG: hypothetical protein RIS44_2393 [Pseudomonadota bacterium]
MFDALRLGALIGLATLVACANPSADSTAPLPPKAGAVSISPQPARFVLPDGGELHYLALGPGDWGLSQPPRYRVYVIPGSGCNGLAPIALAYFRGLAEGEVVVVHKRHVDANRWMGSNAKCSQIFVRHDRLDQWAQDARAFVTWHLRQYPPHADQPVALVGISEGAELLPMVAANQPEVVMLALVGSTGLDPLEALQLQALRQSAPEFVAELTRQAADDTKTDDTVWAGRSLGYWRTLLQWRYSQPLLAAQQALWFGFGTEDEAIPLEGLRRFQSRAQAQGRRLCLALFAGADHGLQRHGNDQPLQQYWASVADALSRRKSVVDCAGLMPE